MTLEARKAYLKKLRLRYKNATKKEKTIILNEYCATTEQSRKHVIRLLSRPLDAHTKRPGPKALYGPKVVANLLRLSKVMKMCSVRMKSALPVWLQYDPSEDLDDHTRALLCQISASTIDRLLRPYRKQRGLSSTQPSAFMKSKIPIELLNEKVKTPGFIEADTVAHCGNSLAGKFANSLTMTDLYSGWTENFASLTKTAREIIAGIKNCRHRMPFSMRGFACDNGSEFLNHELIDYLSNKNNGYVKFVRRRPYKKNDNAHVEQKNDTHVRQLFGYDRIDHPELVEQMNDIYRFFWNPLLNHFYPVMKLKSKTRIGGKVRKVYDTPATPYARLLASDTLPEEQKERLNKIHQALNPFELEKMLKGELSEFRKMLHHKSNLISEEEIDVA